MILDSLPLIKHNSIFKTAWNFLILITLVCFSFLITYRMVFRTFQADGLYYCLNALFLIDLLLGFVSTFKRGHVRIEDPRAIRKHYLKSWFAVDLLAFLPFEMIPVAIFGGIPTDPIAFHIYLALQSLTLIKLVKAVRIFDELQEALGLSPAIRRLASFGFWFIQAVHLMSLGWILIGASEPLRSQFDQYLRAFYWVTTTIATIGYGDYYPNHDDNLQLIYTIIVQFFGVGMYSFIIANVSSFVSNLDIARASYQRHIEEVNVFLRTQKVPADLQERVRDYYSYLWSEQHSISNRTVIEDLPPSLSIEILMHQNSALIRRMEFFKDADELFIREAVKALHPRVFLPQEYIIRHGEYGDAMYFLTSGELSILVDEHEVATLGSGSLFGEAALVTEEHRNASVKALTYGTGYQLSKHDFNELRIRYPEFDKHVIEIVEHRAALNKKMKK